MGREYFDFYSLDKSREELNNLYNYNKIKSKRLFSLWVKLENNAFLRPLNPYSNHVKAIQYQDLLTNIQNEMNEDMRSLFNVIIAGKDADKHLNEKIDVLVQKGKESFKQLNNIVPSRIFPTLPGRFSRFKSLHNRMEAILGEAATYHRIDKTIDVQLKQSSNRDKVVEAPLPDKKLKHFSKILKNVEGRLDNLLEKAINKKDRAGGELFNSIKTHINTLSQKIRTKLVHRENKLVRKENEALKQRLDEVTGQASSQQFGSPRAQAINVTGSTVSNILSTSPKQRIVNGFNKAKNMLISKPKDVVESSIGSSESDSENETDVDSPRSDNSLRGSPSSTGTIMRQIQQNPAASQQEPAESLPIADKKQKAKEIISQVTNILGPDIMKRLDKNLQVLKKLASPKFKQYFEPADEIKKQKAERRLNQFFTSLRACYKLTTDPQAMKLKDQIKNKSGEEGFKVYKDNIINAIDSLLNAKAVEFNQMDTAAWQKNSKYAKYIVNLFTNFALTINGSKMVDDPSIVRRPTILEGISGTEVRLLDKVIDFRNDVYRELAKAESEFENDKNKEQPAQYGLTG